MSKFINIIIGIGTQPTAPLCDQFIVIYYNWITLFNTVVNLPRTSLRDCPRTI